MNNTPISNEAREITKWARENKLGYVHDSVLEEFAQLAINSATEKLREELKLVRSVSELKQLCVVKLEEENRKLRREELEKAFREGWDRGIDTEDVNKTGLEKDWLQSNARKVVEGNI